MQFAVECRQKTFFTHPSSNLARGGVVRAVKQNDKKEEVCLFLVLGALSLC
eukprot:COSAG06_NODE_72726_length_167_cov_6.000000_1_plen_50_part_01